MPAAGVLLGVAALALVLGVLLAARAVEAPYAVSLTRVLAQAGGALAFFLFVVPARSARGAK